MESKSVLITGGSRGIGKQLVSAFLDEVIKLLQPAEIKANHNFKNIRI